MYGNRTEVTEWRGIYKRRQDTMRYFLLISLAGALMLGCTYHYGSFSTISTKEIDLTKPYLKGTEKVIGKDTSQIYLIIPTKWHPDASEAVKDALQNSCAEYLTDAELTLKIWYIPYIYGKTWFEIEGYPWYLENVERQSCLNKKAISPSQGTQQ
jgi:hypothetical protein